MTALTLHANKISSTDHQTTIIQIDHTLKGWGKLLQQYKIGLLINACGPYQGQNYHIAEECIACSVNYIDIADAREFVCKFSQLDAKAQAHKVFAITGASSVPGLSSAVVDNYLDEFKQLHSIQHGINPGNKTPRGEATVKSIMSYCGQPFYHYENSVPTKVYGWQNLYRRKFPEPMGTRFMSSCDIPDLELFPKHYPNVKTVTFDAGLELSLLHLGTWIFSWLARWGLVKNWGKYARPLKQMSELFYPFGSEFGGMYMELEGIGDDDQLIKIIWYILAGHGDGPQIPCTAAIVLARQFALGKFALTGAQPCLSLFTLEDFMAELAPFDIHEQVEYPD